MGEKKRKYSSTPTVRLPKKKIPPGQMRTRTEIPQSCVVAQTPSRASSGSTFSESVNRLQGPNVWSVQTDVRKYVLPLRAHGYPPKQVSLQEHVKTHRRSDFLQDLHTLERAV